jgi:hypothetical protein
MEKYSFYGQKIFDALNKGEMLLVYLQKILAFSGKGN